jgi:hypothetical protein
MANFEDYELELMSIESILEEICKDLSKIDYNIYDDDEIIIDNIGIIDKINSFVNMYPEFQLLNIFDNFSIRSPVYECIRRILERMFEIQSSRLLNVYIHNNSFISYYQEIKSSVFYRENNKEKLYLKNYFGYTYFLTLFGFDGYELIKANGNGQCFLNSILEYMLREFSTNFKFNMLSPCDLYNKVMERSNQVKGQNYYAPDKLAKSTIEILEEILSIKFVIVILNEKKVETNKVYITIERYYKNKVDINDLTVKYIFLLNHGFHFDLIHINDSNQLNMRVFFRNMDGVKQFGSNDLGDFIYSVFDNP